MSPDININKCSKLIDENDIKLALSYRTQFLHELEIVKEDNTLGKHGPDFKNYFMICQSFDEGGLTDKHQLICCFPPCVQSRRKKSL